MIKIGDLVHFLPDLKVLPHLVQGVPNYFHTVTGMLQDGKGLFYVQLRTPGNYYNIKRFAKVI